MSEHFYMISASHYEDFHQKGDAFYMSRDYRDARDWMIKKCKEIAREPIGAILIFEVPNADEFFKG